jgi:hypothetical protein
MYDNNTERENQETTSAAVPPSQTTALTLRLILRVSWPESERRRLSLLFFDTAVGSTNARLWMWCLVPEPNDCAYFSAKRRTSALTQTEGAAEVSPRFVKPTMNLGGSDVWSVNLLNVSVH